MKNSKCRRNVFSPLTKGKKRTEKMQSSESNKGKVVETNLAGTIAVVYF